MHNPLDAISNQARCLLLITLCTTMAMAPVRASDGSDRQQELNGGYYLLHKLADDESQLPLLLDIKTAPPEVVSYADQISKAGKETAAVIEKFHDRDPQLEFDRNPLPRIEQEVRDSIKGDKQHQLLFGTKDGEFVRALCVAQIEASSYAMHLSQVLADRETSPVRAEKLRRLSTLWLARREDALRILRNY